MRRKRFLVVCYRGGSASQLAKKRFKAVEVLQRSETPYRSMLLPLWEEDAMTWLNVLRLPG